nr:type I polyketide synthase [Smaragdicoccus niigatensis]
MPRGKALIDRLRDGEPYALAFGGQGGTWHDVLTDLAREHSLTAELKALVAKAAEMIAPVADELLVIRPGGFEPFGETLGDGVEVAIPGVFLTQLAAVRALKHYGLDPKRVAPVAMIGHSQGIVAVEAMRGVDEATLLAITELAGAAGRLMARRHGIDSMLAISNATTDEVREVVARTAPDAFVGMVNGRRRTVVSGTRADLEDVKFELENGAAPDGRSAGSAPVADFLPINGGFHHPIMFEAADLAASWARECGMDPELTRDIAARGLADRVEWVADVEDTIRAGAKWIIDMGTGDQLTRMTSGLLKGRGVGVVPVSTQEGQRTLITVGAEPTIERAWTEFAPKPVKLADGRVVVETAFTKLTGRSPILLAGMTPTTVDARIVAAAANAGFWAELAGGGQVTEPIFAKRVEDLKDQLDPGRAVQFNALFLDPYLWKLQVGGKRLLQKARAAGAPFDGVIITAGIPELDEAVALIHELRDAGISHVAFKPGTVAQIRSVIKIAKEVPEVPIIVHIEGGKAGGHHSWEDLDDLLMQTYPELRSRANLVVCVGGGIGTPERAAEYLTGRWAHRHDYPTMPIDGILIGTAAMAALEATTSPQVKQLLVETGSDNVVSGKSQLGASIHEIDNSAARCGRLLDEVAGDGEAVKARREEIIEALSKTAKPYFGDLATMTYAQWIERYLQLTVGPEGHEFGFGADLSDTGIESLWADITWRDRFQKMLQRAEARLHPFDRGQVPTQFAGERILEQPHAALVTLVSTFPDAEHATLHPADIAYFVELCRLPGKPVNFVPVVDRDVRRWWRSDSLWQAHDPRYSADQVCIIPGTEAVAGITAVDEPIGELLARFEDATVKAVRVKPVPVAARRRAEVADGIVDVVLAAPDVLWAGRLTTNPVARFTGWSLSGNGAVSLNGAALHAVDKETVELTVPLGRSSLTMRILVPATCADGGAPIISADSANKSMRALLGIAAGTGKGWSENRALDHAMVTGGSSIVPDSVVGACWPAIFGALGDLDAIEGLLQLVHLDHHIEVAGSLADGPVEAEVVSVTDTAAGRVIEVRVRVGEVATMVERFAILGRNGAEDLTDPQSIESTATPRRRRSSLTVTAPDDMRPFAQVSGDHNPIHTSVNAAKLAGLGEPIVHGMWLSAAAQHAVKGRITAWTTRFLGMVRLGDEVAIRVDRVGVHEGSEVVEVVCHASNAQNPDGDLVMTATARVAPPKTAYAMPGQGIQRQGMGLAARGRSAEAKKIWDRADKHTRDALGFSILAVVRDNPKILRARGTEYRHPDGVLHLTQFTQVAMAVLAVAQVAELREAGVFVEDSYFAGHSVGEYTALAAIAGVLPLEAVLEVVFQRGTTMHQLVPRDSKGRSNYRMAAIRPSKFGLADDDVVGFVNEVAQDSDEFLEVVNLNLRGAQYAIAGTVAGIEALERRINDPKAFIVVPGIDVPFHSTVLRDGVPDFRHKLDELLPEEIDYSVLLGRYIPNLVPKPFSLDREFVQEIADLVPSEPLNEVLANFDSVTPAKLARTTVIELLAWQFASPVRWIETQDLLFGELGVERFIEVGIGTAPTVANLASKTIQILGVKAQVLNVERDAAIVTATDTDPVEIDDEPVVAAVEAAPAVAAAAPAPVASSGPRPDDIAFTAADATKVLIAQWTKVRLDQLTATDSIEGLTDGVSSRRNQLLMDLGAELNLGQIDGAAEAALPALEGTVLQLARGYKPLGPVLGESIGEQLRKVFGPTGKKPSAIGDRVSSYWGLSAGWVQHVTVELALSTRDGSSVRGGDLGGLKVTDAESAIDAAVTSLAARRGVQVSPVATESGAATVVDSGAVLELSGVLEDAARMILKRLSPEVAAAEAEATSSELADLVAAELGTDWVKAVSPVFDDRRALLLDDRWASAREDLARMWLGDKRNAAGFRGAGSTVARQAAWWAEKAASEKRSLLAKAYRQIAEAALHETKGDWADDVAVVTGASKGSIAAAVTAQLLAGGATVVATTSRLDDQRLAFFKELYASNARSGAKLWVVPANMASYTDVDSLVEWLPATPTMLFPFAAPRVMGDLTDAGGRAETEMRVLLWSVERLIGGLSRKDADHDLDARLHVVLPGSPNRGMFGGDGAYGESKAALDAVVAKWSAERSWASRVTIAHALIGWVRGTGLMGHNDPMVEAVEKAGVRTWSTDEMAAELLGLCTASERDKAAGKPLVADFTGGLSEAELDLPELARAAAEPAAAEIVEEEPTVAALPAPPSLLPETPDVAWGQVLADPSDLVVIVGMGELGPLGSARTRFEMEVEDRLSTAGVIELAWSTGLITWDSTGPNGGGWLDADGQPVAESEIADRFHDEVVSRIGIRSYVDDFGMVDHQVPLLASVFLDKDLTFTVASEAEAKAFVSADPEHTTFAFNGSEWQVTRHAGTEIRVPRKMTLTRTVGGQIPTGFDPAKWGLSAEMTSSLDRVSQWNLVSTVDAFLSSGFTPAELMRWVHPSLVANTQGSGLGGMTSLRSLMVDQLLGEPRPNDILQEALGNVIAAHTVQSYVGSYGAMVHPVAACATAAVSVEEGVDKIRLGKAEFVVAGGFDDISAEAIQGFSEMSATADSAAMAAKGINPRRFSRANDRRRGGFVESSGGGTVLLARGDVAMAMGLPVHGVVAWAQSFADGVHTSIPAPGLGAVGAARGRQGSGLARSLAQIGLTADDITVVSKHDTSTAANDPNEAEVHERLAEALGRTPGNPLFVISQKSLTGHAKGGAAAFQIIGLCQALRSGIVPPNRSLDCVDDEMAKFEHLVWARKSLVFENGLKAGLVTSLGFGHVSGLVCVAHPQAFIESIPEGKRAEYLAAAQAREIAGRVRISSAMHGGDALYERPADRRVASRDDEGALLLSNDARLGEDGVYLVPGAGCR